MSQKPILKSGPGKKPEKPARANLSFSPSVPPLPPIKPSPELSGSAALKLSETQTLERLTLLTRQPGTPAPCEVRQLAAIHSGPVDATGRKQGFILSLNDPRDPNLVLAQYKAEDLGALLDLIREHLKPKT